MTWPPLSGNGSGCQNTAADVESRAVNLDSEWHLDSIVLKQALTVLQPEPCTDLFASRVNHQLHCYVATYWPDPKAHAINHFSFSCTALTCWIAKMRWLWHLAGKHTKSKTTEKNERRQKRGIKWKPWDSKQGGGNQTSLASLQGQQQGERFYPPHSRSVIPSPHRTPFNLTGAK